MRVLVVDDDKPRKSLEAEQYALHVAVDGEDREAASRAGEAVSNLDPSERDRMVIEQLPEVRYIARRIHDRLPPHVALEDLVHAGILGLIEAVHRYDPTKHVQLRTYAKYRIQGAILDSLRSLDWGPRALRKKARQLEDAHNKLRSRFGRTATEPELAEELSLSLASLQHLLGDLRGMDLGSLQSIPFEDGHEPEASVYLPNAPEENPYFLCLRSEMKELLARAIHELPPRESQVVALYDYEELTMKEAGALLGVGEARVSQIHTAALIRLRERMRELLESRPYSAQPALAEEEVGQSKPGRNRRPLSCRAGRSYAQPAGCGSPA